MNKMRIAIIGQGRSGRNIHGAFLKKDGLEFCQVVCVAETDEFRRNRAAEEYGCDVVSDYRELFGRTDIDLVVNATFSHTHYSITKDLLEHGFNVLCEKPFARSYYECMDLILTAKKHNCVLSAFHQSLYNPAFLHLKEVIASGKLGRILQINLKYSGFARRWDWQTLQCCCAGGAYNTGPHPIGQALDLLDWDENAKVVYSSLDTALTSGDGDDYCKLLLSAPEKPLVDIEVISADAFAGDYVFKVYGSMGTITSTNSSYKMKYVEDFSAYPERPVTKEPLSDENGNPIYCSEKLTFTEDAGKIEGTSFDYAVKRFYQQLYNTVMLGTAPEVTPEMAARVIEVIHRCHTENPLPVKFD